MTKSLHGKPEAINQEILAELNPELPVAIIRDSRGVRQYINLADGRSIEGRQGESFMEMWYRRPADVLPDAVDIYTFVEGEEADKLASRKLQGLAA
jgi:hypothetical protein